MYPRSQLLAAAIAWGLVVVAIAACSRPANDTPRMTNSDSAFVAVQARGADVMGVDQYTSTHVFEDLPNGGRIVLQRNSVDSTGTATIRIHMNNIAVRFAAGDFTLPGMVHDVEVPGTKVMAERKQLIRYVADTLPRGGQVRIITTDATALAAVREFLVFQRTDHRAMGHEGMKHEP